MNTNDFTSLTLVITKTLVTKVSLYFIHIINIAFKHIPMFNKRKTIASIVLGSILFLNVNMQIAERERVLKDHRELTQALEGGNCTITPISEYVTPSEVTPRTLLTSYPGSGKRFTWLVISALT